MKAFGLLLVAVLVGLASCQSTPPDYGHFYEYSFDYMNFFTRAYGSSGSGEVYYDYDLLRQKISVTDSERTANVDVYQFFHNSTQYTYHTRGSRKFCTAQSLLYTIPDPDGEECHYNGTGLILRTKAKRWNCDPMSYTNYLIYFDLWTDTTFRETPLREVETYSTTDNVPAGSAMFDIFGFRETKPAASVWELPAACDGKEPGPEDAPATELPENMPKVFFYGKRQ